MPTNDTPREALALIFTAWQEQDFAELACYVQPTYIKILERQNADVVARLRNTLGMTMFGAYAICGIKQGLLKNMRDATVEIFEATVAGVAVKGTMHVHVNLIEEPFTQKLGWYFNPISALRRTIKE